VRGGWDEEGFLAALGMTASGGRQARGGEARANEEARKVALAYEGQILVLPQRHLLLEVEHYSYLSATMGSILAARRAGT
jgi:hypothetical protein